MYRVWRLFSSMSSRRCCKDGRKLCRVESGKPLVEMHCIMPDRTFSARILSTKHRSHHIGFNRERSATILYH